ncbi:small ribosomal subunit protein bS21m [Hydra vulgaris]|uniref:28S ribosomal protein S21,mitochondrial n=1 Tax=Hydra vulgaris TaxID=6087 RepID=T2MER5_HYDVU|nr:28S ribosomal protein S21, mitochondrial [Hydra vulgaris]
MAHHAFRARTVMVGPQGPIVAYQNLMKIMSVEGLTRQVQLQRRYEKPTVKRHRLAYEKALYTYNTSMNAKINLLMRGHRTEYPWS